MNNFTIVDPEVIDGQGSLSWWSIKIFLQCVPSLSVAGFEGTGLLNMAATW